MTNWKVVVGLTGGMGSGKSTVLKEFERKGAFGISSDQVVSGLLKDKKLLEKIRARFGNIVFDEKQNLDRSKLAAVIFKSARNRKDLENLIHPMVLENINEALSNNKGTIAVCEVPLLFEKKWQKYFDFIVVVSANLETRLIRLKKRGFIRADALRRMKAQWPLARKIRLADFVVDNNQSLQQTRTQVNQIWKNLKNTPQRGSNGIKSRK